SVSFQNLLTFGGGESFFLLTEPFFFIGGLLFIDYLFQLFFSFLNTGIERIEKLSSQLSPAVLLHSSISETLSFSYRSTIGFILWISCSLYFKSSFNSSTVSILFSLTCIFVSFIHCLLYSCLK